MTEEHRRQHIVIQQCAQGHLRHFPDIAQLPGVEKLVARTLGVGEQIAEELCYEWRRKAAVG